MVHFIVVGRGISDGWWWWYPYWYCLVCIRLVIIGIPSRVDLVLIYLVYIEQVLVFLVSTELIVWTVLVKLFSGNLE